jgi:protein phosphatase
LTGKAVSGSHPMTTLIIPDPCLVVLVGPSGAGKSTFARRHFKPTEILSSDFFRALIADDEGDQSASGGAFELLYLAADKRLARGRLTVIDATNVQPDVRRPLLAIARRHERPAVAVVFDLPEEVYHRHNQQRPGRQVNPDVVRLHSEQLRRVVPQLPDEGFREVHVLTSAAEIDAVVMERRPPAAE